MNEIDQELVGRLVRGERAAFDEFFNEYYPKLVGPRNAEHFAAYTRLDLRANRDVQLRNSKLSFYLEVTNLLNSQNECCVEDYHLEPGRGNSVFLATDTSYWLPMLPSFGFQWEF